MFLKKLIDLGAVDRAFEQIIENIRRKRDLYASIKLLIDEILERGDRLRSLTDNLPDWFEMLDTEVVKTISENSEYNAEKLRYLQITVRSYNSYIKEKVELLNEEEKTIRDLADKIEETVTEDNTDDINHYIKKLLYKLQDSGKGICLYLIPGGEIADIEFDKAIKKEIKVVLTSETGVELVLPGVKVSPEFRESIVNVFNYLRDYFDLPAELGIKVGISDIKSGPLQGRSASLAFFAAILKELYSQGLISIKPDLDAAYLADVEEGITGKICPVNQDLLKLKIKLAAANGYNKIIAASDNYIDEMIDKLGLEQIECEKLEDLIDYFRKNEFRKASLNYYSLLRNNGRLGSLSVNKKIIPDLTELPAVDGDGKNQKSAKKKYRLEEIIAGIKDNNRRNLMLTGGGGSGKTVSLIEFWEKSLEEDVHKPVPVYIPLSEYKNGEGFILDFLQSRYCRQDDMSGFKKIMNRPLAEENTYMPSVVLMLDGFNEIRGERDNLIKELRFIQESFPGVMVIITSRNRLDSYIFFNEYYRFYKIDSLTPEQIAGYLDLHGKKADNKRLFNLLKNPMLLTFYTDTSDILTEYSREGDFRTVIEEEINVKSQSEIYWNYLQSLLVKYKNIIQGEKNWENKAFVAEFILFNLLPVVGYRMELDDYLSVDYYWIVAYLTEYIHDFSIDDFARNYQGLYAEILVRRELQLLLSKPIQQIIDTFTGIIIDEFNLMDSDDNLYYFTHQNLRDFTAAVQILNEIKLSLDLNKNILEEETILKKRALPPYLHRFIGELAGEHYNKPVFLDEEKRWFETSLTRLVDRLRGRKTGKVQGYYLWNIIEIWKKVRGELTGVDLGNLDLSAINFSGTICRRKYQGKELAADFGGSNVDNNAFRVEGHVDKVNSVVYNGDESKILSASADGTIKEWSTITGKCLNTYAGHRGAVNSAVYSRYEARILSASEDGRVIEWLIRTGEEVWSYDILSVEKFSAFNLQKFGKSYIPITGARYSKDGNSILITCDSDYTFRQLFGYKKQFQRVYRAEGKNESDVKYHLYGLAGEKIMAFSAEGQITIWKVKNKKENIIKRFFRACWYYILHTFLIVPEMVPERKIQGIRDEMTAICYNEVDDKIITASRDGSIVEYGAQDRQFQGHQDQVNTIVYDSNGKKVLSTSDDGTIKEWSVETGECLQTFRGHKGPVLRAQYNKDEKRVLSYAADNKICEWDVSTGQILRVYHYNRPVTYVRYNGDNSRIIAAYDDGSILQFSTRSGRCIREYR